MGAIPLLMCLLQSDWHNYQKKLVVVPRSGDYDNDGDIDIFLNNSNQPATAAPKTRVVTTIIG